MKIFWGAGRLGQSGMRFCRGLGMEVDYFCDSNAALWGTDVEGIKIISPEEYKTVFWKAETFVTCLEAEVIAAELIAIGVPRERIHICTSYWDVVQYAIREINMEKLLAQKVNTEDRMCVDLLFDVSYGFVLGGVETWSVQTAKKLEKSGWLTGFVTCVDSSCKVGWDDGFVKEDKCLFGSLNEDMPEHEKLLTLAAKIINSGCRRMIVNFPWYNLIAACVVKKYYPERIKIIAVVHSDDEIYYQQYSRFEQYIDKCLIISNKIKTRLLEKGFPESKLEYLPWEIPCEEQLLRSYAVVGKPLRIGYAGRIVIMPKRIDLLLKMAAELRNSGVQFKLEIAGMGEYVEEMNRAIEEEGLNTCVQYVGVLKSTEIQNFWKRQDVMVSCSDWEGHSISQGEAMAVGAIPVITNVSGAADDVVDGENGFLTEIGNVQETVEKILYLYTHRDILPLMGEKAHKTILNKNNEENLKQLWEILLQ